MTMLKEKDNKVISKSKQIEIEKSLCHLFVESFNQAAKAFSQLLMREMVISRYSIEMTTVEQFTNLLEDRMEDGYFASIMKLQDGVDTTILFLLTEEEGKRLYNILSSEELKAEFPSMEDLTDSIGELNNILGSNFTNCLANTLNHTICSSVPANTLDLLGAILESVVLQCEFVNKNIICAEADICDKKCTRFNVKLIILSDKTQLMKILSQS